ncbi:MAG TPA: guanine deaminase [Bryobacteraceae bacterium]|nr:guanine deaminase [Bryobacteraceae bacterium]
MATATTTRPRTRKIAPLADSVEILRAPLFHTPGNPFEDAKNFVALYDGALAIQAGRVAACGDYIAVRAEYPDAAVRDLRDGCILPGFVDTHAHFPQVRILGGLGLSFPEWLETLALPEEGRLGDTAHARVVAREFVQGLASHGTTTALVFGSHFAEATAELFHVADHHGLRLTSGLVLSDRNLPPGLCQTPATALSNSRILIEKFHASGRMRYAVIPRFAPSASEAMLEVCQTLLRENAGLTFTTHVNESTGEIAQVKELFPWAPDYLAVYEKYDLIGRSSVLAHNVHGTDSELARLAERQATIAHCPGSNAALGNGIFPMQRHLSANVRFALGSDVGAGTGFGILKEALQAGLMQRVAPEPMALTSAQLLWMATRAGAEALSLADEIGDFTPGKAADLVYIKPAAGTPLHAVLAHTEDPERMLSAVITLAGAESVCEVRVEGDVVYEGKP